MEVMYATDRNYATICGISIFSLLENNKSEKIHIYIFEKDLLETKKKFLSLCNDYNVEFTFIDIKEIEEKCKLLEIPRFKGGYMAYARLFANDYICENKIIYIDCDTIITGSIKELWEYDLKENAVGGVIDCINGLANLFLGKNEQDCYYNSGVMLIDCKKWKDYDCLNKIKEGMKKINIEETATYGDQDIINYSVGKYMTKIPLNYNVMYLTRYFSPTNNYLVLQKNENTYYSAKEIESAKKKPIIIHYAGRNLLRPWCRNNALSNAEQIQWNKYKEKSPWANDVLENIVCDKIKMIFIKFYLFYTPSFLCFLHGLIKRYSLKIRLKKKI